MSAARLCTDIMIQQKHPRPPPHAQNDVELLERLAEALVVLHTRFLGERLADTEAGLAEEVLRAAEGGRSGRPSSATRPSSQRRRGQPPTSAMTRFKDTLSMSTPRHAALMSGCTSSSIFFPTLLTALYAACDASFTRSLKLPSCDTSTRNEPSTDDSDGLRRGVGDRAWPNRPRSPSGARAAHP